MMRRVLMVVLTASLCGCGIFDIFDSDDKNAPAVLKEVHSKVTIKSLWKANVGSADRYFFHPAAIGDDVLVADHDGNLVRLNATTGAQVWKITFEDPLSAGVGADAGTIAVASIKGDVVAFDPDGKQRWKVASGGEVLSPPAVGDGLVVTRTTDGRFVAFDSGTGARRWSYSRAAQPLVLRTGPGMVINSGLLYAGLSGGRLIAITDGNGGLRWDVAVTIPRGATELERVADVMGAPVLAGRDVCVATFQGRAGCYDAASGNLIWSHEVSSTTGIGADGHGAYVTDEKSEVLGFSRTSGTSLWKNTDLTYRTLTRPVPYGASVVVGDYAGYLHWLSEDDGSLVGREATDGSAIRVPPVVVFSAGERRMIVQTVKGGVFAYAAQ